ncbi:MAG: head-tail connector protein [Oscillospiraceae bacterium]|nr:head-tail connector protein [Oscillospiraceae bacterium]
MERRNRDGPEGKRGPDLKRLARQLRDMESIRNRYFPVWQEIAKYIVPGRGVFTKDEPNQGERKDRALLDPTPLQAMHVLSAGLQGGLTSPSRPWFRLGVADGDLADFYPVRLWLDEVERRIFHVLSQSNVYNALHTLYQEVSAFGVGAMLVEEDMENVVRAHTFTAGEFCLSYGLDGLPNRFGREFWMSAQQMEEEFGEEALSDAARAALKSGRLDQWFRVCQMIYPDEEAREVEFPVLSVYWEEGKTDSREHGPLAVRRYASMPVLAPRWEVVGGDYYGRGPGWDALGESKMLQELRADAMDARKYLIKPPVVAPNRIHEARPDLRPGGVTLVDDIANPNQYFRPIFQVKPDEQGQIVAMQDSREIIKTTFFVDLFLAILRNPNKNMTATQVNAIQNEQMTMIGPVYERLDHELLDPFVGRVFGIMDRFGLIPEPPEELAGQELKIDYISMLAQAQQMVGLSGIDRLTEYIGAVAQFQPEALDVFDTDSTIDEYARMLGTPAAIIRSDEAIAAIRQQRAEQQAQAQQMEAAQQMAGAANAGAGALRQAGDAAANGGVDALAGVLGLTPEEGMA